MSKAVTGFCADLNSYFELCSRAASRKIEILAAGCSTVALVSREGDTSARGFVLARDERELWVHTGGPIRCMDLPSRWTVPTCA